MSELSARLPRERRRAVEEKLAEHGLVKGPRRLAAAAPPLAFDDEAFAARLGAALAELGPLWATLGRYLGTRLDLLEARDALVLARLDDRAPAASAEELRAVLRRELEAPAEAVFRRLEARPVASRLLSQTHRAELASGEPVLVRWIRPGVAERVELELDAAPALGPIFAAYGRHLPFDEVLGGWRRELAARLDLQQEAEGLELLLAESRDGQPLALPRVHREHTTPRVIVVDDPRGRPLEEISADLSGVDRDDLARRLCLAWLRQALLGPAFPIEADVVELADGRLAWTGGVFASLPAASQVNLWDYLRATAGHDPDQAATCLRRELAPGRRAVSDGELRSRLRQVVPFRDGGWSSAGETMAEYAVLHWRVSRSSGFQAPQHVASFYRGLFWAACTAQPVLPDNDPLHDAFENLQWIAGWNQFRQLTAPGQLAATFESYLATAFEWPQKLERTLALASDEQRGFRVGAPPARRRRRDAAAAVVALLLAMAAVVVVARPFVTRADAEWGERLAAAGFAALAFFMLRTLWRTS
ncbi:MAG TPA: AarF/UbiB family protein [Thermoanaerobaculia bacterium]